MPVGILQWEASISLVLGVQFKASRPLGLLFLFFKIWILEFLRNLFFIFVISTLWEWNFRNTTHKVIPFFFQQSSLWQSSQKLPLMAFWNFKIENFWKKKRFSIHVTLREWKFQNATLPTVMILFFGQTFSECSLWQSSTPMGNHIWGAQQHHHIWPWVTLKGPGPGRLDFEALYLLQEQS